MRLRNGVDLPEGRSAPAEVMIVSYLPATLKLSKGPNEGVWLRVVLREGKKRQIRHMTAAVGYPTLRLLRWAIGPLTLGDLELGQARPLKTDEINALRKLAGLTTIKETKTEQRNRPGAGRGGLGRSSRSAAKPTGPAKRVRLVAGSKSSARTGKTSGTDRPAGSGRSAAAGRPAAGIRTDSGSRAAGGRPQSNRPGANRPGFTKPGSRRAESGQTKSANRASNKPSKQEPRRG